MILQITGSGTAVGIHSVLRFGPLLLLGIPAGLLTDRHNRWRLLITTQTAYAVAAAILALASFHSYPSLYLIYGMVLVQGIINAIDNPLRRSFVRDLVTDGELANAVSLNSTGATVARFVGPAIGGVLIASVGVPWCFAINAISYGAVLLSLFLLDHKSFQAAVLVSRAWGQLREGFRYAVHNRRIGRTLIMVALLGTFVWNWTVILPLYATDTFHGGATLYGWLLSLLGLGSFAGALLAARLVRVSGAFFRITGALLTVGLVAAALAPCLPLAIVGLVVLGAASIFVHGRRTGPSPTRVRRRHERAYPGALQRRVRGHQADRRHRHRLGHGSLRSPAGLRDGRGGRPRAWSSPCCSGVPRGEGERRAPGSKATSPRPHRPGRVLLSMSRCTALPRSRRPAIGPTRTLHAVPRARGQNVISSRLSGQRGGFNSKAETPCHQGASS